MSSRGQQKDGEAQGECHASTCIRESWPAAAHGESEEGTTRAGRPERGRVEGAWSQKSGEESVSKEREGSSVDHGQGDRSFETGKACVVYGKNELIRRRSISVRG